mmetsp:Transcript_6071/g.14083  ORF Transcript_6071/g.14083 Transcript_6071/m.14083 type:complete len:328 (-) Transcript_6071:866-1849(-)
MAGAKEVAECKSHVLQGSSAWLSGSRSSHTAKAASAARPSPCLDASSAKTLPIHSAASTSLQVASSRVSSVPLVTEKIAKCRGWKAVSSQVGICLINLTQAASEVLAEALSRCKSFRASRSRGSLEMRSISSRPCMNIWKSTKMFSHCAIFSVLGFQFCSASLRLLFSGLGAPGSSSSSSSVAAAAWVPSDIVTAKRSQTPSVASTSAPTPPVPSSSSSSFSSSSPGACSMRAFKASLSISFAASPRPCQSKMMSPAAARGQIPADNSHMRGRRRCDSSGPRLQKMEDKTGSSMIAISSLQTICCHLVSCSATSALSPGREAAFSKS